MLGGIDGVLQREDVQKVGRFWGVIDKGERVRFGVADKLLRVFAIVKVFDFAKVAIVGKDFYVISLR